MSNFGQSKPAEARAPETEILPDGRRRLTRFFRVAHKDNIPAALALAFGTPDPGATPVAGWTGVCRLIGKKVTDQTGPAGQDTLPLLVLTYEEISPTAETQVGQDGDERLEDGRTATTADFLQFSTASYGPGTVGSFSSRGYLMKVEETNDGTLRRIKRTWVTSGILATNDETKEGGALSIQTITSAVTVPATPVGYTLIGRAVQQPAGLPVHTYTFARGSGTVDLGLSYRNQGKLVLYHRIGLGSAPATPSNTLGGTVNLIGSDVRQADGYAIYDYTWAEGLGVVSSSNSVIFNGAITTTTKRAYGTPVAATGEFETSTEDEDGYVVYVSRGLVVNFADLPDEVTTRNQGKLVITRKRKINAVPSGTGAIIFDGSERAEGYTVYTRAFAVGSGLVASSNNSILAGAITYTTKRAYGSPVAATGEFETSTEDDDGYTVYVSRGLVVNFPDLPDEVTYANGGLLTQTRKRKINAVPTGTGMLVADSAAPADGYTVYERVFAVGTGQISRQEDYDKSSDQGATGITTTTLRYLTAASVTTDPTTLPGSIKTGVEFADQDQARLWTVTYKKGTGLIVDEVEFEENGAMTTFHRVALGAIPAAPTAAAAGLNGIVVTAGGSGYTSAPTVSITGGGGSGATATAVISGGAITALTLTGGGSGYTSAPTVGLSGGGGTGATATATLATRSVASLTLTAAGSGYTSAPTASLTGGGGTGATASVALTPTTLATISLTSGGSGYTSAPTVALTGGGGTGATATANVSGGTVTGLTLTAAGSGYTSAPTLAISGGGGTGATATATLTGTTLASLSLTATGSGYTSPPTLAITGGGGTGATATATLAAQTVASIGVTAAGSGYTSAPTVALTGGGGTGATATAGLTAQTVASLTLTAAGSGYTSPPTLTITGGGGTGATATATLAGTTVASITVTAAGSGYTSNPTVTITGGGGTGATATAVLAARAVSGLVLTDGGAAYYAPPAIAFSGGGGSGVAATPNMISGVGSYALTAGGSGYTSDPTVVITGGGGSGASATVTRVGGAITSVDYGAAGSGYTSAPTVTLTGGGGSGATATAILMGGISRINVFSGGSGYTSPPTVTITNFGSSTGTGAVAYAQIFGGQVVVVRISNGGAGYSPGGISQPPGISFSGGGGTGASATSQLNGIGPVDTLTLTAAGSGYTSAPAMTFSGGDTSIQATGTTTLASTTVTGVTVTAGGSGYTSAPAITISGGGGSGATASAAISPTTVASLAVTGAGSGYTSVPSLGFSGGGGTGAAGTCGLSAAVVASVTLTASGSGYTSPPTVGFSGGGGSGATATAALTTAAVASLTLTAAGSGYTAAPTLGFSGGGGSGAAGTAAITPTSIASLAITAGGSGYTSVPTLGFTGGGGTGAAGTVSTAGVTITGLTLTAAGSGYTSAPAVGFSGGGGTGAAGVTALTPTTLASLSVTAAGSGYTSPPTVGLSGGGGTGGASTTTLTTAAVTGLTLTGGGSGYTSAPTVSFSGGGGAGATATATVASSTVLSVTLTAAGTGYTSAPTIGFSGGGGSGAAAVAPAGGVVVIVAADMRKEAGFDVYDYRWKKGFGVIDVRTQAREDGLRLETWVSLGTTYDVATMKPAGIVMLKDEEAISGGKRFTVTCMQSASGGADPTAGTAVSVTTKRPFTYPGRAKAYNVSFTAYNPGGSTFTANIYDVFLSPPVEIMVDATIDVTYQTSGVLGSLPSALWNPDNWATVRAHWEGWYVAPRSLVQQHTGYRAVGSALSFTATAIGNGFDYSCMGERVFGGSSGTITVSGGPSAPDGNTYTLAAGVDASPAFTAFDGTKYFRKTVVTATIPTQTALPV